MSESKPRITDVQQLQRAIFDGLEDVKGQDIVVFNTEHLSPLFERVIIASGTSNRQTKALAMSVSEAVREAGFPKPRMEGEDNGEWIIVDCGAAVAHVMQPNIRQYYHLEEIWGGKVVHLKSSAPVAGSAVSKTAAKTAVKAAAKSAAANPTKAAAKSAAKPVAKRAAVKAPVTTAAAAAKATSQAAAKPAAAKPSAAKPSAAKPAAVRPAAKSASGTAARKAPVRKTTAATGEATPAKVKTLVVGKPPAKKAASAKPVAARAPRAPRARNSTG